MQPSFSISPAPRQPARQPARRVSPAASGGGNATPYGWIALSLLVSCAVFQISPLLAVVLQLVTLCAVVGGLPFFLMAVFATMPFQQSLAGGESSGSANFSAVDVLAGLLLVALLFSQSGRGRMRVGPVAVPIFTYIGILIASSLSHWEGFTTAISLARMVMATLVAVLIFANFPAAFRLAHRGFAIFLVALDVLAFFAMAAFAQGGTQASMYTLGINKNALGPTFGCGIVICMIYLLTEPVKGGRDKFLKASLGLCTIGCFLSLSRGAWVATTIAYFMVLILAKNKRAFWTSLVMMVPLLAVLWRLLPKEAVEYAANVSTSAHTVQTRFESIAIVVAAFNSNPLIGVGIGLRKAVEPHNVLILTLGESGIIGLLGFLSMFGAGFYTFFLAWKKTVHNIGNRQLVLIGTAVLLLSLVHGCMDVYWRRGIGFLGWAGVGLAVQVLAAARAEAPLAIAATSSRSGRGRRKAGRKSRRIERPVGVRV